MAIGVITVPSPSLLNFLSSVPTAPTSSALPPVWFGAGTVDPHTLSRLRDLAYLRGLNIPYGQVRRYLSFDIPNYVGVRDFARRAGVENLLAWNPETRQVTLGGYTVPYSFGYQGRTYADPRVVQDILRRILEQRSSSASSSAARSTPSFSNLLRTSR